MHARGPSDDPDLALWRAWRADGEAGFEAIVRTFLRPVLQMVRHLGLAPDEAEDVSQEVFLRVWRGLPRFRGEATLRSWVLGIAIREASRRLAREKRHRRERQAQQVCGSAAGSPPGTVVEAEQDVRLRRALRGLSDKHRQVVVLRYLEERSCEEVAAILGCSLGTVHSRLHHARRKLKRLLDNP